MEQMKEIVLEEEGFDLEPEHRVEFNLVEKGKRLPRLSKECELHFIFSHIPHAALWPPSRPFGKLLLQVVPQLESLGVCE